MSFPDEHDSGATAPENDDLRSQLVAAFAAETPELPATGTGETEGQVAPEGETAAQKADRLRDQQGRFAKGETAPAGEVAKPGEKPAVAGEAPKAEAAAAETNEPLVVRPPHGWSPEAKAAFGALPEHVQQAVAKREAEVNKGFEKLADYKGLEPFADIAKQAGTTVAKAVESYRNAEILMEKDFVGGVAHLAQHYGKHPVEVAAGLLRVHPQALVSALRGGQAPAQAPQPGQPHVPQQQGLPPELMKVIAPLHQAVSRLDGEAQARSRATEKAALEQSLKDVDTFFNDPSRPYAHNLEAEILDLVSRDPNASKDRVGALQRAYDNAVYLNPAVREVVINDRIKAQAAQTTGQAAGTASKQAEAAVRARQASRSVTGSPVSGAAATGQPASSLRGELERAFGANRA